jgi:serine/threonine protein kinase
MTSGAAGFTKSQPRARERVALEIASSGATWWSRSNCVRRDRLADTEKRFMRSGEPSTARTRTLATRHLTSKASAAPSAPLVLDRYQLQRRLGAGAFGTVWMARDERLEREVAVKILPRERVIGGRFEREARAAARLSHPAIVTLYEAAVDDEGAYLVSELVRGETLDALLEQGQLSDRDIVAIALALCDALQHAHDHGVVHRDVKPSNVLVPDAPPSPAQVAKLTDFGVAHVVGGDALTKTGDVLGTLAYMAPEQAEGLEAAEPADLYSLALVIYEALSGVNPVRNSRPVHASRRLAMHLPSLRRQRRDLPRPLAASIDLALRSRPRERGTLAELRGALADAQDEVGDEPGVVTGAWTATLRTRNEDNPGGEQERERLWRHHVTDDAHGSAANGPLHTVDDASAPAWPPRALGAAGAAGLTVWLIATTLNTNLQTAPVGPAAAGLLAAAVVLLLPRLGWVALTIALAAVAVSDQLPGAAGVIALALVLPAIIAPAAPTIWPLSAGAPALGLLGLAGAWPALAGRATTPWRRATLGAVGWVWLLLASAIAGKALYLPQVPGVAPPHVWMRSLSATVDHLVRPEIAAGVLAPALVWALAAVALPWLVRGASLILDVVRVVVWAALTVAGTGAAVAVGHGTRTVGAASTAVVGTIACAAVALAPSLLGMWRAAFRADGPPARVP